MASMENEFHPIQCFGGKQMQASRPALNTNIPTSNIVKPSQLGRAFLDFFVQEMIPFTQLLNRIVLSFFFLGRVVWSEKKSLDAIPSCFFKKHLFLGTGSAVVDLFPLKNIHDN